MVKFFLGSINCPLRPISNPSFVSFFICLLKVFSNCPNHQNCESRICQIRKTPCVSHNLVRENTISLKPSPYIPLSGQLSVIRYELQVSVRITICITDKIICITSGITIKCSFIPDGFSFDQSVCYKSSRKAITSSDTSSQELSGVSPKHITDSSSLFSSVDLY